MPDDNTTGTDFSPSPAPRIQDSNKKPFAPIKWLQNLWQRNKTENAIRDAIENLFEEDNDNPESSVAEHERMLISNILDLRDLPVVDVMIPRADIMAVDINTTQEELITVLAEKPHSRIPVYRDELDNIVGAVHMKELLASFSRNSGFELKEILRDVMIVSPAMRVLDLLLQMRQSRVHIALVVDEFGGIDGIITINDLIEAIVGEIDDEYDYEIQPQMIERPDGSVLADGRYALEDFEEGYGNILTEDEKEEVETLGGLVTHTAGRVPGRGEIIEHHSGIEFEIIDADPRRIMRLRMRNLPGKTDADETET